MGVNELKYFEDGVFAQHQDDKEDNVDGEFWTAFINTALSFGNFTQTVADVVQVDTKYADHESTSTSWSTEALCKEQFLQPMQSTSIVSSSCHCFF